ncbi:MAG: hypothetical protein ACI9DK_001298 [Vicingaceae bacterium]|jgi:hypothetical protein
MKIFYFLFTSLISICSFAQGLKVVHVSGEIYSDKVKRNIAIGDQIDPSEMLHYSGSGLSCFLFDGKNKLSFKPKSSNTSGIVSDLFQPPISRQLIASRGIEDSSYLSLEDYFASESYLFFNQSESFLLNPSKLEDQNSIRFFVVDNSEEKRELSFTGGTIQFDHDFLFPNEEKSNALQFYKINTSNGEISKLTKVTFYNVNEQSIKEQLSLIISLQESSTKEQQITNSFSFLQSIFGNLNIKNWNSYFKLNYN